MAALRSSSSIWRRIGLVIAVLILGFPVAMVFTHGTILVPLLIVIVLGPLGVIHYVYWGWWLSPEKAGVGEGMGVARHELASVLSEARSLLARPGNDFAWSSWEDADAALAEVDGLIAKLEVGRLPSRLAVSVLFAPTGPIQEVSLSSGWADEFLTLAARCDAAVETAYKSSWWRRPLNWRVGGQS